MEGMVEAGGQCASAFGAGVKHLQGSWLQDWQLFK